jgi:hypothetical protein
MTSLVQDHILLWYCLRPRLLHSHTLRTLAPPFPPSRLASPFRRTPPSFLALRSHTPPRPSIPPRLPTQLRLHQRRRCRHKRLPMRTGLDLSRSLRQNRAPLRLPSFLTATEPSQHLRSRRPSRQQLLPRPSPLKNLSPLMVNLRTRRGLSGNRLVLLFFYLDLSYCCSHLFLTFFLLFAHTILPTVPAALLCTYVIITDAPFPSNSSRLTARILHSRSFSILFFFFCELMGLGVLLFIHEERGRCRTVNTCTDNT